MFAEEALRESEERFRLIANTAPVMIWMSGAEKQITYLNQTWLDYTGRPLDAALGQRRAEVLHPDEAERCREVYAKAFEQREPFQMEHRLRRHDGEYRWVVTAGVPRYNVDGSFAGYIGTAVDITERKLAEEALSTVSQKLIEAHEEESSRIARELHDDINQRLAVVSVRLGYLKQSPPASAADLEQEIGEVSQEIADLAADIQALSHGLHPAKLELLGLEAAAAGFCEELSNRHGVTIDVHFENIPKALPREISLCLYRVLQEALQNVVKHSVSRHAHVSLNGHIDTINLTVKDSGAGFRPSRGDERARARLDQHEGAVEGRGRAAFHPLAAGTRHDDSRGRASPSPTRTLRTSFDNCWPVLSRNVSRRGRCRCGAWTTATSCRSFADLRYASVSLSTSSAPSSSRRIPREDAHMSSAAGLKFQCPYGSRATSLIITPCRFESVPTMARRPASSLQPGPSSFSPNISLTARSGRVGHGDVVRAARTRE